MLKIKINGREYCGEVFLNDEIIDEYYDFEHFLNRNIKTGELSGFNFIISGFVTEVIIDSKIEYQIFFHKKIVKGEAVFSGKAGFNIKTTNFVSTGTPETIEK